MEKYVLGQSKMYEVLLVMNQNLIQWINYQNKGQKETDVIYFKKPLSESSECLADPKNWISWMFEWLTNVQGIKIEVDSFWEKKIFFSFLALSTNCYFSIF